MFALDTYSAVPCLAFRYESARKRVDEVSYERGFHHYHCSIALPAVPDSPSRCPDRCGRPSLRSRSQRSRCCRRTVKIQNQICIISKGSDCRFFGELTLIGVRLMCCGLTSVYPTGCDEALVVPVEVEPAIVDFDAKSITS